MKPFSRIFIIIFLSILALSDAVLAEGNIKGQLHATVIRRRTMGPMAFDAELEYTGSGILEGNIILKFQENLTESTVVRFGPVGLRTGRQTVSILVPPLFKSEEQIDCRLIFDPDDGDEIDLGLFTVMMNSFSSRTMGVCVGQMLEGAELGNSGLFDLAQSLRLEQFHPNPPTGISRDLAQAATTVDSGNFPTDPLLYCIYDLVVLKGEALHGLREKQLEALSRWVRGGGSICLVPDTPLQQQHLDFINGLCAAQWTPDNDRLFDSPPVAGGTLRDAAEFRLDEKGMLVTPAGFPAEGIGLFRADLGRVALIARPYDLKTDPQTAAWRQMSAFLWKAHASQSNEMVANLKWRTDQEYDPYGYFDRQYGSNSGMLRLAPQPLTDNGALVNLLMPKTVRLIPGWVVATMMLGFLVVIGPGDYLILGFFKKRKYTWVLLPVVCGLFAWGTMALSNHYLGVKDQTRHLTIVDFGADGKPVRTNRLTLLFAGRQKTAYLDHERCYFADLTAAGALINQNDYYTGRGRSIGSASIMIDGRVPAHYRTGQHVQQWTAQVNREFSFEPPKALLFEPRWRALAPQNIGSNESLYNTLGVPSDLPCAILVESAGNQVSQGWVSRQISTSINIPGGMSGGTNLLHRLGTYPRTGFMSIVSQVSPHGGPLLEDLAIHDETDFQEYAVHILLKDGDDFVLYRRIYRAGN